MFDVWCWSKLARAAEPGGKPEKSDVVVTYAQPSGAFTPIWVAYEAGLFKKYGLNANLQLLTPQVSAQAVISEEADFYTDGPDLINARLHGGQVKYFGGTMQQLVFQIWGAKEIKTIQDLKGKAVAASTPRAALDTATREALKKNGLVPDKDVQILYVQSVPAILSSILGGKTAAGTLSAPNTIKAKESGLNLLVDVGKLNIPAFQVAYGATEKYLKNNPNTVYAFLKAIAEGVVLSRKDPAVAKKAIGKYAKIDDAPTIDGTYDAFAPYWAMSLGGAAGSDPRPIRIYRRKRISQGEKRRSEGFLRQLFRRRLNQVGLSEKSRHEVARARASPLAFSEGNERRSSVDLC